MASWWWLLRVEKKEKREERRGQERNKARNVLRSWFCCSCCFHLIISSSLSAFLPIALRACLPAWLPSPSTAPSPRHQPPESHRRAKGESASHNRNEKDEDGGGPERRAVQPCSGLVHGLWPSSSSSYLRIQPPQLCPRPLPSSSSSLYLEEESVPRREPLKARRRNKKTAKSEHGTK